MNMAFARKNLAAAIIAALVTTGCTHLGPKTVVVDRFDYAAAIADSWKQQTLLNIVKVRYVDLPVFMDVASVVSGYSMETSVSLGGQISSPGAIQGDSATLGGSGRFTDRPTITYVPMTGEKFLRGLITPIDPKNIFFMLQAGYAADFLLGLAVESINGVRNRSGTAGTIREADPDFVRALELLRDVQAAGGIGMRVEQDKAKGESTVLFVGREDLAADLAEKAAEVRRLLKLQPGQSRYLITYSPMQGAEGELAVSSRSMLQIITAFATYVDVPEEHAKDHGLPAAPEGSLRNDGLGPMRIHSSREKPANAYAAVQYRGYWFWVDNADWRTKRAMVAVIYFFTLAESGDKQPLPLVTIPTL